MSKTIDYYNTKAKDFFDNTFDVDMQSLYEVFCRYLPATGKILDVGCGSGRDALYFSKLGYDIEAIDYSPELVKLARKNTGLDIQLASFYDIHEQDRYAGVWACASLLHCERDRLPEVIQKLINALENNGVCYLSFKYGDQTREKEGRTFTDLNEAQSAELFNHFDNILIIQQWITVDKRPDRTEEWLNILFRKIEG